MTDLTAEHEEALIKTYQDQRRFNSNMKGCR